MGEDHSRSPKSNQPSRFGSIAVYRGYASLDKIQRALVEQVEDDVMGRPHRRLGEILLDHDWMTAEQVRTILEEMGVEGEYISIPRILRREAAKSKGGEKGQRKKSPETK